MISVGISKLGKTEIHFIEPGERVNADYYCNNILAESLLPSMNNLSNGNFVLQQDGARPHTAQATLAFLAQENVQFCEPEMWPPCSPDLSPCDYFLFGPWKDAVYRRRPQNLEEMRNFVREEFANISQRSINAAIDQFLPRVQAVVENEGGHIEHVHF